MVIAPSYCHSDRTYFIETPHLDKDYILNKHSIINMNYYSTSINREGQSKSNTAQAISSLYVLKAICAFIVVMIHTPPVESVVDSSILSPFVFVGVPIFYMITGYFLFHRDASKVAERALRSSRKVLIAVVLLNLIYLVPQLLNGKFPFHSWGDVFNLLIYGGQIEGVFWYITALLQALVCLYLFCRIGLGTYIKGFLLLIPLGILFTRYAFVLGSERFLFSEFTMLWLALPYITLGYALHEYEERLLGYKWEVLALIFFVFGAIEVFVINHYFAGYWGRYISTPLFATALFMWCLQHKSWGADSVLARIGRDYSGSIYYYHKMVDFVVGGVLAYLGIDAFYHEIGVLYIFVLSLGVSYIAIWIQDKLKINLLR